MTPALRKYHRRVWNTLAIVVPITFAAAIFALPKAAPDPQFNRYLPAALPEVLKSTETAAFTVRRRINRLHGEQQLEVFVRQPLTVPAALIYASGKPDCRPEESTFIGSLSSRGEHRFRLGNGFSTEKSLYLLLFDPVKNKVFETMII